MTDHQVDVKEKDSSALHTNYNTEKKHESEDHIAAFSSNLLDQGDSVRGLDWGRSNRETNFPIQTS